MLVTTSKTIHCLPLIVYSCVNNTFYRAITRMPGIHTMCQIKKKVMRWWHNNKNAVRYDKIKVKDHCKVDHSIGTGEVLWKTNWSSMVILFWFLKKNQEKWCDVVKLINSTVQKVYQLYAILSHLMFFVTFSKFYFFPSCKHRPSGRYIGQKHFPAKSKVKVTFRTIL